MLRHADNIIARAVREHILHHFIGHHIGLTEELDEEHNTALLGVEMQFLGLDINVGGQDIVQHHILDKGALVVLFIVQILDVGKRNGKQAGNHIRLGVLAFHKSDILALGSVGQRAVGTATGYDHVGGIRHLIPDALTNLPNLDKLGTGDNHAGLVDYADDPTANGILHLVDDTLKQSV